MVVFNWSSTNPKSFCTLHLLSVYHSSLSASHHSVAILNAIKNKVFGNNNTRGVSGKNEVKKCLIEYSELSVWLVALVFEKITAFLFVIQQIAHSYSSINVKKDFLRIRVRFQQESMKNELLTKKEDSFDILSTITYR